MMSLAAAAETLLVLIIWRVGRAGTGQLTVSFAWLSHVVKMTSTLATTTAPLRLTPGSATDAVSDTSRASRRLPQ